ncbi:bifunctional diaminohydroxyphosphoribosylaminopyrimidine deaminase/5-amino-6-(5-phosphoribosylamino)uracil reductase RibD [Streptomyces stramineus]
MRRAVELAGTRLGRTSPNPVVGCVVLAPDGTVVGEGFHKGAGHPHAEPEALAAAGDRARGATAVVTLEPCAHTGRTGPCADALLRAGVARVLYAVPDPNPGAAGGAERLRAAGVEVVGDVLREEAERVNELWLTAIRRGRPCVTWKFGGTLDGRSAAPDGTSRWITGPAAREDAHRLRASHDAVLVGSGTLRADDPHLGLRHGVPGEPPLRVVLDRTGSIPPGARVLDDTAPTLVAVGDSAPKPQLPGGHEVLVLPETGAGWTPPCCWTSSTGAGCARCCWRAVPAWPRTSRPGPARPGGGLRGAHAARLRRARGPRRLRGRTLTEGLRLHLDEVRRLGDDVRMVLRGRPLPGAREER